MPFAIPMIWRELSNHVNDCYFCMIPPVSHGMSRKKKATVKYPKIPSAILPVPHADGLPIPIPPVHYNLESDVAEDCGSEEPPCPSSSNDPDFVIDTRESCQPKLFCQAGLN